MKNIPEKIYLQIGEECDVEDYEELDGVTFCGEKIFSNDIEYIRPDCGSSQLCEGWRDARKDLPPVEHEVYFIYDKEGSMAFAHYLGEGIFGGWPDVIAWMPLPSPPAFA